MVKMKRHLLMDLSVGADAGAAVERTPDNIRVRRPQMAGRIAERVVVADDKRLTERVIELVRGIIEDCLDKGRFNLVDVWLVPGLAFTRNGKRLGHGGGWYDRLLADAPKDALKIGIAHAFQVVDDLPGEPHDILLSKVVVA